MIAELFRWLGRIILGFSLLYGVYQAYISLHMFGEAPLPVPRKNDVHRFAVFVCACNEAGVLPLLLDSLAKQNYPHDAFDVFVTADNCTDDTAALARQAGAVVFERTDPVHRGKGYALNWAFARFFEQYAGRYDACCVFDADNVADGQFLAAMNRQLNAGQTIAVGYRMGKNPADSWVAGCSTLFWLMQTRLCFVPRVRMGIPCFSVGGTGFMFDLSVLGGKGWHTHSICEDIEFTLDSIAAGHFVAYAPDAVFYDEQPLRFGPSLRQRYRWSSGAVQVTGISGPKLLRALFSRHKKVKVLDAFLYSFGTALTGVSGLTWCLALVLNAVVGHRWKALPLIIVSSLVFSYISMALCAMLILHLEKKKWPGRWKVVLTYPIYLLSWAVINVLVLFFRKPQWSVVPHTASLSIEEVEHTSMP